MPARRQGVQPAGYKHRVARFHREEPGGFGPGSGPVSAASESTIDFARGLNKLGFAVMRYDKRGTGRSDGEVVGVSTANSDVTIPLLAADMQAVMDRLADRTQDR